MTHSSDFAAERDAPAIATFALNRALKVAETRQGNVQLIQWEKKPTLEIVVQRGFEDEFLTCFRSVSMVDPSACGRALMLRRPVLIEDVLEDQDFAPFRDVALRAGFRSVQSMPLMSSNGALYGVLSTHQATPGRPSDAQMEALQDIAHAAADAIVALRIREGLRPEAAQQV